MVRVLDFVIAFIGLIVLFPLMVVIYIFGLIETGSPLFFQERVGQNKKVLILVKFRTMALETESTPTHLVSSASVTKLGAVLRKSKLDELPQLWNVLIGEMSLVGPRPGLFNQTELIYERERLGIFSVRPGITGLAQVSKIDMSTPKLLAEKDSEMIKNFSIPFYFKYIFQTLLGKGNGDRIA